MTRREAREILDIFLRLGEIDENTHANILLWLDEPEYKKYRKDILAMIRPGELIDSFRAPIPFGTGGRRGRVGVGPNRINERTIAESAQGLARAILDEDAGGKLAKKGVAIAYDVRVHSRKFAGIVAEVLAGNGVTVHLFDDPRSTPELSFAVRYLGCVAGVVLTASHNPPTDNGFKAYWKDGGQVVAPYDKMIMDRVMAVNRVQRLPLAQARKRGLVRPVKSAVNKAYLARFPKELGLGDERRLKIVFSPLHGTGVAIVPAALSVMGFSDVHMPEEQVAMDGAFPSVPENYPNPERPSSMGRAVELAEKIGAELVMASDPDGDRLGVFVSDGKGGFCNLSGNQVGAAMCRFILESLSRRDRMPPSPFVLTTMVSTQLTRAICRDFRVKIIDDLLVGFKNIAHILDQAEAKGRVGGFVFAFEESIGFLRGGSVRDKDAAAAAVICAQMAARLASEGRTVPDYLDEIYRKYGYYCEDQRSVFLRGADGAEKMAAIMTALRRETPRRFAGLKVHRVIDRKTGTWKEPGSGRQGRVAGVKGDVLQFWLDAEGKNRLSVRPSGTEPKIKYYAAAFEAVNGAGRLNAAKKKGDARLAKILAAMKNHEADILGRI